jgi:DNA-binding transcriptional regulator/RsmH inhibitor MraZ
MNRLCRIHSASHKLDTERPFNAEADKVRRGPFGPHVAHQGDFAARSSAARHLRARTYLQAEVSVITPSV